MMLRKFLLLAFCFPISNTYSQAVAQLDINNIRADVYSTGTLFKGTFEVPRGSLKHTFYLASFWMGGLDSTGQLHIAAQTYGDAGNDIFYGPIATNYSDPSYISNSRVSKVGSYDINNHIAFSQTPGYVMPSSIQNWPGNGNTSNGEPAILAPYQDVNNNGIYDPVNGDYPIIKGDEAAYFICNDARLNHTETGGASMGLEFHGMLYGFASGDPKLAETEFLSLEIFNRSNLSYDSVYFGLFIDVDLGGYLDDYIGYDSLNHLAYTYNSSSYDQVYGNIAPAQGCLSLNTTPAKFISFNGGSSNQGYPTSPLEYYRYLKGEWRDGSSMTYGGNGSGGTTLTDYLYTGRPENSTGWSELGLNNMPGERSGLLTFGPFHFSSHDKVCYDFAFPFAQGVGNQLNSLAEVRTRSADLQTSYDTCACTCSFNLSVPLISNSGTFSMFPNPSNGKFKITTSALQFRNQDKLQIFSSMGKLILEKDNLSENSIIDLSSFPDGVYFAKMIIADKIFSQVMIKQ